MRQFININRASTRAMLQLQHTDLFKNRVACEGSTLPLRCTRGEVIAIESSTFGHGGVYVPECPPSRMYTSLPARCLASHVTEAVMAACHGRPSCELDSDRSQFDLPSNCSSDSASLRVTFACVDAKILKTRPATSTTTTTSTTKEPYAVMTTTLAPVKDHEGKYSARLDI